MQTRKAKVLWHLTICVLTHCSPFIVHCVQFSSLVFFTMFSLPLVNHKHQMGEVNRLFLANWKASQAIVMVQRFLHESHHYTSLFHSVFTRRHRHWLVPGLDKVPISSIADSFLRIHVETQKVWITKTIKEPMFVGRMGWARKEFMGSIWSGLSLTIDDFTQRNTGKKG